ncbi:hypothetical protein O6P43_023939 [Quillaja saponaria]|uniref:Uncharacterized protein n=1 Tax=Quillaja saponaria TaxID=32244 RepID=A0AAD7LGD5_QUISA|nr:hypothetical protein O6P43_023939 [Quillaja saponaria]
MSFTSSVFHTWVAIRSITSILIYIKEPAGTGAVAGNEVTFKVKGTGTMNEIGLEGHITTPDPPHIRVVLVKFTTLRASSLAY